MHPSSPLSKGLLAAQPEYIFSPASYSPISLDTPGTLPYLLFLGHTMHFMPHCPCTCCSLFLGRLSHVVCLVNSYSFIKTQLKYPHFFTFPNYSPLSHFQFSLPQSPFHKYLLELYQVQGTVPCARNTANRTGLSESAACWGRA